MLDYLKTVESLTVIRDEIRSRLEDETRDRQSVAEFAEASLTQILGELVTPDSQFCLSCHDNGHEVKAVGHTDTGEGVCAAHILPTLLAGVGVRTDLETLNSLPMLAKLAVNSAYGKSVRSDYPPAHCAMCGVHLMPVDDGTGAVSYLDSTYSTVCASGRLHEPRR